jgi:hypothetical protein
MDPVVRWIRPNNVPGIDAVTAAWPRLFTREIPDGAGGWKHIEVSREEWVEIATPRADVWPHLKDERGRPLEHRLVVTRDLDREGPGGRIGVIACVYENGFVTWSALPHLDPHPRGYSRREARRLLRVMVTDVYDLLQVRPYTVLDDDIKRADPARQSPVYMAMCDSGPFTTEYDIEPQGPMDPNDPDGPKHGALVFWKDGRPRRPHPRRPRRGFPHLGDR